MNRLYPQQFYRGVPFDDTATTLFYEYYIDMARKIKRTRRLLRGGVTLAAAMAAKAAAAATPTASAAAAAAAAAAQQKTIALAMSAKAAASAAKAAAAIPKSPAQASAANQLIMDSFSVLADPTVQRAVNAVSDAAKMRGGANNMAGGAPTPAEIAAAAAAQADELVKCAWFPLGTYSLLSGGIPPNYGRGSSVPNGVMYVGPSTSWASIFLNDGTNKYFYMSKTNLEGKDNFTPGIWPAIPHNPPPSTSKSVFYFKFNNASNNVIFRMDQTIDAAKYFYINNVLQLNYVQSGPNGKNPVIPPTVGTGFNFGDQFTVSFALCNPDVLFPEAQAIVDAKKAADAAIVKASAADMVKVSAAKAASAAEVVRASAAEVVRASAAMASSALQVQASAAQASSARQKASAAQASAAKAAQAASITSSLSSKVTSSAAQETLTTTLDALSSPAVQTAMDQIAALATPPTGGARKRKNLSQRVKRSKRGKSRKVSRRR